MALDDFHTGNPRLDLVRPDPRDRNASSIERLMSAAICLLVENGTDLLAESLTPDKVTRRAGKSRASYYRTGGFHDAATNGDDARRAVLEGAIEHSLRTSARDTRQVVDAISSYIDGGWVSNTPSEFIRAMAVENFESIADHSSMMGFLAGALATSSPSIEDSLRSYYCEVTASYTRAYEDLFRFWGYRPRPPITTENFAILVMALAEGLILRHFGDGEVNADRYAELLEAVGSALLVPEEELAAGVTSGLPSPPDGGPLPSRGTIIDDTITMFALDRHSIPTVEEVARTVGCSPTTIRSQFGDVIGIIRAAWSEWTPEFEEMAERDIRTGKSMGATTTLRRVALAVARRAHEQQAATRALLMSEIGTGARESSSNPEVITGLFERLIVAAIADKSLRFDDGAHGNVREGDAWMLARALRNCILSNAIIDGGTGEQPDVEHPQRCVDRAWRMLRLPLTVDPS